MARELSLAVAGMHVEPKWSPPWHPCCSYPSDDINKFLWMVRIGGGVFPEIKEPNYLAADGERARLLGKAEEGGSLPTAQAVPACFLLRPARRRPRWSPHGRALLTSHAGNYRVDDQAGKALLDSTMWK